MDKLFETGTVLLNKYKLEEVIGKGGFGAVYKATDLRLRRTVAIKTLLHGETSLDDRYGIGTYEEFIRRFEREAEISSYFTQNPHVITVYGLEQDSENNYYLVLEYLEGGSLNEYLRKIAKPLPVAMVYTIAKDICRALSDIHNHPADIIHRDLKPANILLRDSGQAVVADFGVAQIGRDSHRTELHSASSRHPGSPPYKSPEQESSYTYLTPASDLYSLGLIIYEMATGKLYKKFQILPASKLNSAIPPVLDAIIEKLLRPNPMERYREAADLREHLEKAERHQLTPSQIWGKPVVVDSEEAETNLISGEIDSTEQSTLAQVSAKFTSLSTPHLETQQKQPDPEPVALSEISPVQNKQAERAAVRDGRRKLLLVVLGIILFFGSVGTVLAVALGGNSANQTVTPAPTSVPTVTVASTSTPDSTVTPLPQPTATVASTVEPTATAAIEPTATLSPTVAPTPEPTVTATPEPTVTTLPPAPLVVEPVVAPTETPIPYQPPPPTARPRPTNTPVPAPPTATPEPTATATPTPEPTSPPTIKSGATPVGFPTPIPPPTNTPPPTAIVPTPNFPTPIPPPTVAPPTPVLFPTAPPPTAAPKPTPTV